MALEPFQHMWQSHLPLNSFPILHHDDLTMHKIFDRCRIILTICRQKRCTEHRAVENLITVVFRIQVNEIIEGIVNIQIDNAFEQMFLIGLFGQNIGITMRIYHWNSTDIVIQLVLPPRIYETSNENRFSPLCAETARRRLDRRSRVICSPVSDRQAAYSFR